MLKENKNSNETSAKLGTFGGVFVPSVLTILGIILFMRLGFVAGSAGFGKVLIIITIANLISITTSFSLSAIATNLKVKVGGDYYLISRTLGLEFGGALGIVLFLAQSVSIAFYCIGFGEVLNQILPEKYAFSAQIISAISVLFLFVFAWLGSDWATRFQYIVMVLLILALGSFFIGGILKWDTAILINNWSSPKDGLDFWILFAIFFPAVTGFTQGVSMSGDLKDPSKSLPKGTFLAVGVSIVIYYGAALFFSGTIPNSTLMSDYNSMKRVALFNPLIDAGVIAATLSSAMASFMGAPRILQSLSADKIFGFLSPFEKGYGPSNNPRRGVLLSCVIALSVIAMGNLNLVASIVSMFFLISYGLLNYATYFEAKGDSPSFRPSFRYYKPWISILGCITCFLIILSIDVTSGLVAFSILFAIYQYLKRTVDTGRWADSRRSNYLSQIKENLIHISEIPEHPRDWRPNILAFSEDSQRRKSLLKFGSWIGGSGIVTAVEVLPGEGLGHIKRKKKEEELKAEIKGKQFFSLVVAAPSFSEGVYSAIQSFGIGPVRANTLLLNWFEHDPTILEKWKEDRLSEILKSTFLLGCNLVVLAEKNMEKALENGTEKKIVIWWWGDNTGHLSLLLAHLMTRREEWENAKIHLLAANYSEDSDESYAALKEIIENTRIKVDFEIVDGSRFEVIADRSMGADIVFSPLYLRKKEIRAPFDTDIGDLIIRLSTNIVFVKAAQDVDLDAEPEEGELAKKALLSDNHKEAVKKLGKAVEEEKQALLSLETERKKLSDLIEKGEETDSEAYKNAEKNINYASENLEKAARKVVKAKAKVEIAAKEAGITKEEE